MGAFLKKLKGIKREMTFMSVILVLAGLFMLIFPNTSGRMICRAVGIILLAWGIVRLIAYFSNKEVLGSFGLVQGVVLTCIGLYILIRPGVIEVFLVTVLGIVVIVDGILKMQYALDFRKLNQQYWWIEFICAVIMVVLGVVVIINPFTAVAAVMRFVGIVFIIEGGLDLISIFYISKIAKDLRD
jgi:uncharacterized membrane protein HdeD (DUF308 family)